MNTIESYTNLNNEEINVLMNRAIGGSHANLARAFKASYPNTFVCTNVKTNPWYINEEKGWRRMKGNKELITFIDENFTLKFKVMGGYDTSNISEKSEVEIKQHTVIYPIDKLINKLSSKNFKETLCREIKIYYMNYEFNGS